ncbi:hypothetical protein OG21DRAFT_1518489 [Imleria badia]|nr:hypothetical protein OG21DRAFT_1518489 [Imleria badia]
MSSSSREVARGEDEGERKGEHERASSSCEVARGEDEGEGRGVSLSRRRTRCQWMRAR